MCSLAHLLEKKMKVLEALKVGSWPRALRWTLVSAFVLVAVFLLYFATMYVMMFGLLLAAVVSEFWPAIAVELVLAGLVGAFVAHRHKSSLWKGIVGGINYGAVFAALVVLVVVIVSMKHNLS